MIFVLTGLVLYKYFYEDLLDNLPWKSSLNSGSYFVMQDDLACIIGKLSDRESLGKGISLLGLESNSPKVFFQERSGTAPLTKFYEDEYTLTLGLIASATGGTDVFVLDKKTGEFARTSSGSLGGVYALASKGICK